VRFRVLGPLELRDGEGRLVRLGAPKQRTLLAVLLLHANRAVGSDVLVEALWAERPPVLAMGGLRTYVSGLRRILGMGATPGAPRIAAQPGGYQLTVAAQELDLLVFERCAGEGQRALADGETALAAAQLGRALGLWRGRAFEDVPLGEGLSGELARLQERRLVVVEEWVEACLALGRHGGLVPELRRLVMAEPLRERLWGQWMLALYRSGRQAEALAAYQQLRGRLVEELGIEPGPPLQQLQRGILRGDVALAPPVQQPTRNRAVTISTVVPRQLLPDAVGSGRGGVGRLLAGLRVDRGLSQEALAERSGMSVRAIRDLERGHVERPRPTSIALLADALALTDAERAAVEVAASDPDGRADAHGDARPPPARMVPRQLPPDIGDFTGRDLALERLHARVRDRRRGSTALVITAAVGKAGVGKTTLAVHAAHHLRSVFPDGQLYVSLRGVEAQALDPAEVLDGFLRAMTSTNAPASTGRCWPTGASWSCWTTRPMRRRSARSCRAAPATLCWSPAATGWWSLPRPRSSNWTCSRRGRRWSCSARSRAWIASPTNRRRHERSRRCAGTCRWRCGSRAPGSPPGRTGACGAWPTGSGRSSGGWTSWPPATWRCAPASR
jgi:DNA-binding SARP family transcriptional activator/transcriptional regulator with XRE-family HTH domain